MFFLRNGRQKVIRGCLNIIKAEVFSSFRINKGQWIWNIDICIYCFVCSFTSCGPQFTRYLYKWACWCPLLSKASTNTYFSKPTFFIQMEWRIYQLHAAIVSFSDQYSAAIYLLCFSLPYCVFLSFKKLFYIITWSFFQKETRTILIIYIIYPHAQ